MVLPLADFCQELHRYGAMIEAPQNWMPTCNQPAGQGLHVALADDGARYVLTDTEKDITVVGVESPDRDEVLEAIFVHVTYNMAAERVAKDMPPQTPEEILSLTPDDIENIQAMATSLHLKLSRVQEDLLGRLSTVWRDRQAARNREQLKRIEGMLDE